MSYTDLTSEFDYKDLLKWTSMDALAENDSFDVFLAGTRAVFYQASVPAGWTKITTQNDKALRVTTGAGGGSGGTTALSSTFNFSHNHPFAAHNHTTPTHSHAVGLSGSFATEQATLKVFLRSGWLSIPLTFGAGSVTRDEWNPDTTDIVAADNVDNKIAFNSNTGLSGISIAFAYADVIIGEKDA